MPQEAEAERRFQALLLAVIGLLQRERRVPYRTLKYVFDIDEGLLAEVRENLRFRQLAYDEEGEGLVWTGEVSAPATPTVAIAPSQPAIAETTMVPSASIPSPPSLITPTATEINGPTVSSEISSTDVSRDEPVVVPEPAHSAPEAERRQLTVMFCDLVGSTHLSGQFDPEDLREVVRAYQETAAEVIQRYAGHIAQYLGDGLLIYFGFPVAHEDDAQRAVYTGLGICEAMIALNMRLETDYHIQLAVRIGIHTGPVVVGEIGAGGRHENLALGETPNIAARLEGLATPNAVVISDSTAQLVQRVFALEALDPQDLKGVAEPILVSRVLGLLEPRQSEDESVPAGAPFLVGRGNWFVAAPLGASESRAGASRLAQWRSRYWQICPDRDVTRPSP
jgi:class 3 adenylate cyclase